MVSFGQGEVGGGLAWQELAPVMLAAIHIEPWIIAGVKSAPDLDPLDVVR